MGDEIIKTVTDLDSSILVSIKKLLGIPKEDDSFDTDIIIHINSVLMILNQIGIGPDEGFSISDANTKWVDYIPDIKKVKSVETYIYLKVKIVFDPPLSSVVMKSYEQTITELEWRLNAST